MDGNLLTSVAIYIPPERSFGAGAAPGDECAPALPAPPSLPGLEVGDGGTRVLGQHLPALPQPSATAPTFGRAGAHRLDGPGYI